MKVFFDTEHTGLHQYTTLISIGLVDEKGRTFYAEFGDFDHLQVDNWVEDNVFPQLRFHDARGKKGWCNCVEEGAGLDDSKTEVYGNRQFVAKCLEDWFSKYDYCEMWSDCPAYDWVLFNQLWGHAFKIPKNIYPYPFDICTLFKIAGIDPDVNREDFVGASREGRHNALHDAQIIKACYNKLIRIINVMINGK